MTDGQVENLFSAEGEMMDSDFWEGTRKFALDNSLFKSSMIPRKQRKEHYPQTLRRNVSKRTHRPDESVRSFTSELCILKKLFALPDNILFCDFIKFMETLEQTARKMQTSQ